MKYVRHAGFLSDLRRLPAEHRKLFVLAVHTLLRPALAAGAHTGAVPWPRALRIHRIGANYSMTCSFASPDGRAKLISVTQFLLGGAFASVLLGIAGQQSLSGVLSQQAAGSAAASAASAASNRTCCRWRGRSPLQATAAIAVSEHRSRRTRTIS